MIYVRREVYLMKKLSFIKNIYVFLAGICIVGGTLLLIWPMLELNVLCRISGVFLLIYGMAKISGYFTKDLFQLAFQFDFGLGIVAVILGILMIFRMEYIITFFAFCIGIFLFVDSALKIQTAIEAKRFGIEKWYWIFIIAVISGIIGVSLLFLSSEAIDMLVRMVGLGICLNGAMNLVVVLNTVRLIEKSEDDFYGEKY